MNIFLRLIGVHEFFFHVIFPCANIIFVLRRPLTPPPRSHKFSNGPSLADCYFLVNVLDLPFASPIAIYR